MDLGLLQRLIEVASPSGEEYHMTNFLTKYILREKGTWNSSPEIIAGDGFQDCLMLVFGKPKTAVYAHMDTVGFTVRYQNQLIPIGSPEPASGNKLSGL